MKILGRTYDIIQVTYDLVIIKVLSRFYNIILVSHNLLPKKPYNTIKVTYDLLIKKDRGNLQHNSGNLQFVNYRGKRLADAVQHNSGNSRFTN